MRPSATDLIVGSPHYMSPEQIRGLKHTDARTDLWALGVILYQLIAGRRPFEGDGLPAVCASIAADPLDPLQTYRPETPPALDALIRRCLEKDPTRRVRRATELARGLAPFRAPQAIPVTEHTPTTRPILPVRPPPAPAVSAPVPVSTQESTTARVSTWAQTQRQPRRMAMPLVAAGGAAAILCALAAVSLVRFRENEGSPVVAAQADTSSTTKPAGTTAPEATAGSQPATPAITAAPEAAAATSPRPAATAQPIARQAEVAMAPPSKPTAASPAPIERPAAPSKPSAEPAPRPKPTGDMMDRWE